VLGVGSACRTDYLSDRAFAVCACLFVIQAQYIAQDDRCLGADQDRQRGFELLELCGLEFAFERLERGVEQFQSARSA